jgi:hypothetical protein
VDTEAVDLAVVVDMEEAVDLEVDLEEVWEVTAVTEDMVNMGEYEHFEKNCT